MSIDANTEFEAVIGLEVHCQLSTDSKIFCSCQARTPETQSVGDIAVNSNTCPVCTGQPGTLPTLNRKVIEFAVKAGLATNCEIRPRSIFARKNYFYPDLPKGYQITQFDRPICEDGWLQIETKQYGFKKIHIERIHIEEDAGKNVHMSGYSLVNLNRAGTPLIEIVSGPDMRSSEEAGAYLRGLHAVVTYLGITDGNMQEGNFRCDANVSVRPKGTEKFGTRAEIKNVNSFRFVEKAIDHEIIRQSELLRSGGKVVQETRGYDSQKNSTYSMRSKEEAHDYRYFPEPDLIPLLVEQSFIEEIRKQLPELPDQKRTRWITTLSLTPYDAGVLSASQSLAHFFEQILELISFGDLQKNGMTLASAAKAAANWVTGEISRLLNEESIEIFHSKLTPSHVAQVILLVQSQELSSTGAKQVINSAWKSGHSVASIVERDGLKQVSDLSALEPVVEQVIAANPGQVNDYRAGKEKLLGFFVGQVMKQTGGKANPALLQEMVKNKLKQPSS